MGRGLFVPALLLACAPSPVPAPEPANDPLPEPTASEPGEDPLAAIDEAAGTKVRMETPTGFDGCQTIADGSTLLEFDGSVDSERPAQWFDGCERNIYTPFSVTVYEVVEGELQPGTITVWGEGGDVRTPDGRSHSTYSTRTCGKVTLNPKRRRMCVYPAGPDYVPACCPGKSQY